MKPSAAYVLIDVSSGGYGVACCVEGEKGYHPVPDYGPYMDEKHTQGVVDRLNERLGVSKDEAHRIVLSTMDLRK